MQKKERRMVKLVESKVHNSMKIIYIYIYIYIYKLIREETCNVTKLIFLHRQFGIDINVRVMTTFFQANIRAER